VFFFSFLTTRVFVASFLALGPPKLPLKLMDGHINTAVSILTCFGANENLAVLSPCNYLHADITTLFAVNNHFDLIDTIVVLGKLGSFFLRVPFDSFGYFDMFTADCEKQNYSP
jgi:hypothetical protein